MIKKIGKVFIIIGCIFLVLSLLLFLYNFYLIKITERNISYLLPILNDKININKINNKENNYIEIDGNKYVGRIDINCLNVSLPVLMELDNDKLVIAPCMYLNDKKQKIIAAHNYPKYFGNLKYLEKGNIITFSDINGNTYNYIVKQIEIIEKNDIKKMIESDYDLTLFTCNNTRTTRITVRCNLIL